MGRFLWAWCFAWLLVVGSVRGARAGGFEPIRVCVRPPDIAKNVAVWAYTPGGKKLITSNPQMFQQKSSGLTVYIFDQNAPPESAKFLPIPHNTLKCPPRVLPVKRPASPPASAPPAPATPKPAGGGAKKHEAPKPAGPKAPATAKKEGAPDPQPTPIAHAPPPPPEWHPGQPTGDKLPPTVLPVVRPTKEGGNGMLPNTTVLPVVHASDRPVKGGQGGKGSGGDAPHKVAEKTALDKFAEELAYAGAIASGQLNEDTKRPDGKRYGIPGGTNADGPNHPVAQAGAGVVLVTAAVLTASGTFEKQLREALKKKTPLLLKGVAKLTDDVAEHLATKWGAKLADALNKNGAIGKYSLMKKFTERMGGRWQAHHILEKRMFERFGLGNPELAPSVILTEAEHKVITAKLKAKTADVKSVKKLWKAYQEVYADHPDWLKAIESYFVKGK